MKSPKSLDMGEVIKRINMQKVIDLLMQIPDLSPTDQQGRYLHWDKFHRIPNENLWEHWFLIKQKRHGIMKTVSFPYHHAFHFCVPDSLQAQLHQIDKTCGFVGTHSAAGLNKPAQQRFLIKSLMMEEAISSAQLEGAATTRAVAKEILKTARAPRTKDEMMIVNNYALMQKIVEIKHQPLDIATILDLHHIATRGAIDNNAQSGSFRTQDDIHIGDIDGNILYQPPKAEELPELIKEFCRFANAEHTGEKEQFIHPVIKAIILHFLIGWIHPFGDGNGRTARALFYWFMLKNEYWLFEYISISRLLKNAPVKYAKSYIYSETDELDMTYFIYYQVSIMIRAVDELLLYIKNKQDTFVQFSKTIAQYNIHQQLNSRQIQMLEKANEENGKIFTIQEMSNNFGISYNTAKSDLSKLAELNILIPIKSGKSMQYISPNDLLNKLEQIFHNRKAG